MMGLAFGVGSGHIAMDAIKALLNDPKLPECAESNHNHFHHRMAYPHGLHLADVVYPPESLEDITDDVSKLPTIGNSTEYQLACPNIDWYVILIDFFHLHIVIYNKKIICTRISSYVDLTFYILGAK